MSLANFNRKKRGFPALTVFSVAVFLLAVLIMSIEMVRFSEYQEQKASTNTLSSNVSIGGVEVSNLDSNEIREKLEAVYLDQPVMLYYNDSPIIFRPREIGFTLDIDAMLAAAQQDEDPWAAFWDFLWRRPEGDTRRSDRVEVDLMASYARADLESYVNYELATRYDTQEGEAGFDVGSLTFQGSASSTRLNIETAMELIDRALYNPDPESRRIELPLKTAEGSEPTMDNLRQAIIDYLDLVNIPYNGTDTVVSVFVIDLETGEEMGIQERVVYSASSTIKVGVLMNYFRYQTTAPTDQAKLQLTSAIICSDNAAANEVMDLTSGNGDSYQGLRNTNQTMCAAGAVNSFIRSRLFIGNEGEGNVPVGYYTIVGEPNCPAKELEYLRADNSISANPDNLLQTTPADIGTMLLMIYECAYHNSGLRAIFPDEITQTECQWMLEILSGTNFLRLAEMGIPPEVEFAHKVGYSQNINSDGMVADAGVVYSPGGDYIFVMYIWDSQMGFFGNRLQEKWDLIAEVSRITYNFYNPDAPLTQPRTPPNPTGGVGCVIPRDGSQINLNDLNENRFGEDGLPLPTACYGGLYECRQFTGWTN